MNVEKVGKFIAQRRKELGYTQGTLGARLGVTDKAVSKWERGLSAPDIFLLNRLSDELKVSLAEVLNGERRLSEGNSNTMGQGVIDEHFHERLLEKTVTVAEYERGNSEVSPKLFGNNLEHSRASVYMGLSAQMLRNRKFAGMPIGKEGTAQEWFPIGEKTYCSLAVSYTRHIAEFYHMKRKFERNSQRICNFSEGTQSGIGQHGLNIKQGIPYSFAIVLRAKNEVEIKVSLTDRYGKNVYAETTIIPEHSEEWKRYTATLVPTGSDNDADIRIMYTQKGCVTVGAVSLMPEDNFRGMRKDVIEEMKKLGISVLRWPGGNFAGEYYWFDGLLPVDERSPLGSYLGIETHPNTMGYDYHEINTDDFIALCREIGAEPFLTINLAWNTPEENAMWVEYCNGDADTKYGRLRAERGFTEPYNVKLWSLGNEMGYGHMEGENTAYGYTCAAMENALAMKKVTPDIEFCSSGPYPDEHWACHSVKALRDVVSLVSMHYYVAEPTFSDDNTLENEYYQCISGVNVARNNLYELRGQIPDNVKISFDEWNVWYAWYRPSCVTDGIYAALMMHMIISEARACGVEYAGFYEVINEGAMEVTADKVRLTATGQILELMKHHAGGKLRYKSDCIVATYKDGEIMQTMVNPSYKSSKSILFPSNIEVSDALLYRGGELVPHSTFSVEPLKVKQQNKKSKIEIPPHSVAVVRFKEK